MRYYSTQRPVSPGCFPKPAGNKVLAIHNYDDRVLCEEIGRCAWGYVEYELPLDDKSAQAYELVAPSRRYRVKLYKFPIEWFVDAGDEAEAERKGWEAIRKDMTTDSMVAGGFIEVKEVPRDEATAQ